MSSIIKNEKKDSKESKESKSNNEITDNSNNAKIKELINKNVMPSSIVFLGFGMVAKCTLVLMKYREPAWFKNVKKFYILEQEDVSKFEILQEIKDRLVIKQVKMTKQVIDDFFDKEVKEMSVICDLAFRISTEHIVKKAQEKNCIYINAATDLKYVDKREDWTLEEMPDMTLPRQLKIIKQNANKARKPGTKNSTCIFNHGINPGLVSHFTKYTLKKLHLKLKPSSIKTFTYPENFELIGWNHINYSKIARKVGLKTIHITEKDTHQTWLRYDESEKILMNTWSVMGAYDESIDPSQFSFGTHENEYPKCAFIKDYKEHGQLYMPYRGCVLKARSYEPRTGMMNGVLIPHAETVSLQNYLRDGTDYMVTIHYVYKMSDTFVSNAFKWDTADDDFKFHVLESQELYDGGFDSVGALLICEDEATKKISHYWTGSILENGEASKFSKQINATCMQVGISILAGMRAGLICPEKGIIEPEEIDSDFIVEYCKDYLGEFIDTLDCTKEINGKVSDQFKKNMVLPRADSIEWCKYETIFK